MDAQTKGQNAPARSYYTGKHMPSRRVRLATILILTRASCLNKQLLKLHLANTSSKLRSLSHVGDPQIPPSKNEEREKKNKKRQMVSHNSASQQKTRTKHIALPPDPPNLFCHAPRRRGLQRRQHGLGPEVVQALLALLRRLLAKASETARDRGGRGSLGLKPQKPKELLICKLTCGGEGNSRDSSENEMCV